MLEVAAAAGAGQFLGVDWGSIALVTITTLVATVAIVSVYSLGLRLLAVGSPDDGSDPASGSSVAASSRSMVATIGAILCIGVGVAAVLYGIYLVIPLFHQ